VFPDAQVKIFMTADVKVRAQRRLKELGEKSINADQDEVMRNIKFRDEYDSQRTHSPLKKARDAIVVDTTDITIKQEIDLVEKIVSDHLHKTL
jgi:cytidylate kinase